MFPSDATRTGLSSGLMSERGSPGGRSRPHARGRARDLRPRPPRRRSARARTAANGPSRARSTCPALRDARTSSQPRPLLACARAAILQAVGALAAAALLALVVVVLSPPGARQRRRARARRRAAAAAAERARLTREQRPHHATGRRPARRRPRRSAGRAPASGAVALVDAPRGRRSPTDARGRVARHELQRPRHPLDAAATRSANDVRGDELDLRKPLGRYACEAAVETASNAGITSTLGVPFVGTIDFAQRPPDLVQGQPHQRQRRQAARWPSCACRASARRRAARSSARDTSSSRAGPPAARLTRPEILGRMATPDTTGIDPGSGEGAGRGGERALRRRATAVAGAAGAGRDRCHAACRWRGWTTSTSTLRCGFAGQGAHFTDVDGHRYLDMYIADMSGFCGHAPPPVVEAVARRSSAATSSCSRRGRDRGGRAPRRPLPDAASGSSRLSATQANTEVIRLAREMTGRETVLVFDGKYHGELDATLVVLEDGGSCPRSAASRGWISGQARVIPFNDVEALRAALEPGDVALVLAEPAMTNAGFLLPRRGLPRLASRG